MYVTHETYLYNFSNKKLTYIIYVTEAKLIHTHYVPNC